MTLADRVADWITGGALARARHERDAAQRAVRAITAQIDDSAIPIEDHVRAVTVLGAVLARFRPDGTLVDKGRYVHVAKAGPTVVEEWRRIHDRLRARLVADRREAHDIAGGRRG